MRAFDDCVAKGRLKAMEPDAERVATELQTALGELERARACFVSGNWDETITQAYFSMYRCARAAINARGYRDTNVYGLGVGLQHLFLEPEELPLAFLKQLREAKDYKDAVYGGQTILSGMPDWASTWELPFLGAMSIGAIFIKVALKIR